MPGKKSVSDPYSSWQEVTLEESGGYTGLRRACHLHRASLHAAEAARVAELLGSLGAPLSPRAQASTAQPDCQSLRVALSCAAGKGAADWLFDTAERPEALDELLALAPPLRPLPPPDA
jgi:hypothetical protein